MPPSTILLLRHAEKPDASRDIRGVDINGHESAAELSVAGWQRSAALPRLFSPGQAAEMLPRPNAIYAAASHSRSARPVRTVELLARTLNLEINDQFGSDDPGEVVEQLRTDSGTVLVCWRHESIADIARAFVDDVVPVPDWDPKRFDVVWTLTPSEGKWALRHRPQLLLPGDSREPMS